MRKRPVKPAPRIVKEPEFPIVYQIIMLVAFLFLVVAVIISFREGIDFL